jgi:hypothetical protein
MVLGIELSGESGYLSLARLLVHGEVVGELDVADAHLASRSSGDHGRRSQSQVEYVRHKAHALGPSR